MHPAGLGKTAHGLPSSYVARSTRLPCDLTLLATMHTIAVPFSCVNEKGPLPQHRREEVYTVWLSRQAC
jgi:hypothetical protein